MSATRLTKAVVARILRIRCPFGWVEWPTCRVTYIRRPSKSRVGGTTRNRSQPEKAHRARPDWSADCSESRVEACIFLHWCGSVALSDAEEETCRGGCRDSRW
jgi:hypothetical protein